MDLLSLLPLLSTAVLILNFFFVFAILFLERGDPTRALIWIMVLLLLPGLGAPLYIFLHQNNRRQTKKFALKGRIDAKLRALHLRRLCPTGKQNCPEAESLNQFQGLANMVAKENPDSVATPGNMVHIFTDGQDLFSSLKKDLQNAHNHIHFEFYQVINDPLGQEILQVLAGKAKEGLQVRVLLDAWGSRGMGSLIPLLRESGVHLVFFYPGIYHYNYRNHRKIVVIDGKIGYCGGYNIGEQYIGKGPLGFWRDTALRIVGPEVYELQVRFIQDWDYSTSNQVPFDVAYFPEPNLTGDTIAQEVSSGPDTPRERIKESYLKMISLARESCYIQTPYFVPDPSLKEILAIAATSGVDVRLMIPDKPDHPFVYWATLSFCADLLETGVRTYVYEQGFLHAKMIVVDGKVASVGSANFDIRSFRLNFETNLIVYDQRLAAEMKASFLQDLSLCTELTPERYRGRGLMVRLKEPFARLLFPLI
ncbi:MAG: cardiolipin synthase [Methanomicrobiales archaeon]|nr:cardiolipin synthase [Methanomicrobiales archaeon]